MQEAVKSQWSTRQLECQINSFFYERLLSSKNNETQIFASKYKLYLPSGEELLRELSQEYRALEVGK